MKNISSSNQIKLGAAISYFTIGFNILLGLLYTPWMIQSLGKDHYALYAIVLSIINIFLVDFGIGSSVTRFLSKFNAEGNQDKASVFLGIVYKVFFLISVVIALVLFLFYFFIDVIYTKFTESELIIFKHLFIIVAIYSVISFPCITFRGVLMANEKFIAVKLCNLGHKVFDVALIIIFLLLGFGVYAMVLIHAVSSMLFNLIRYIIIRKSTSQKADLKSWDSSQAKELFGYSIWVTVNSLAQRCIFNIMPTIIAALIGSVEVTFFSIAATLEGYVYTFSDAINGMFMPKVSRILVSDNVKHEFNSLMCKVGKFHVYTLGLIIIGFICIGRKFVNLWMGDSGCETIYVCSVLLMLPSLFDVPQQVARTSLLALNIVKEQSLIYIIMALVNIVISVLLVPSMGAVGAAIAVFAAYMFRTIMFNILYKKKLPIMLGKYFVEAYKGFVIPAIVSLSCGFASLFVFESNSWLHFLISGCILVFVYIFCIFFFGFDKKTKDKIIHKLLKK